MPDWRITRYRGQFAVTWDERGSDGRSIRRRYSLGTEDRKEAERRAPARYAELTRPQGTSVAELWNAYRIDREGRRILERMEWSWKALEKRFGARDAKSITVADCRAHTAERRKAGRQDGTIHTELGHLRIVLRWAQKMRLIDLAPHIERPSAPPPKDGYLTREEVARMLAGKLAPHTRVAIHLLIGTGCRIGAALDLTWDRVDFDRGVVNLRNPFDREKRKGRAIVPMNNTLKAVLLQAHDSALSPFVIEFAGGKVGSMKRTFKTAGKSIGREDVSPHIFRHSAAVWLAEDDHSMEKIAQFLGHTNSTITAKVYARYSPNHLRELAGSLEMDSSLRFSEPEKRNANGT